MRLMELLESIPMGAQALATPTKRDYTIGFEFEIAVDDDAIADITDDEDDYDDSIDDQWERFSNWWYGGGSTFDFESWFDIFIGNHSSTRQLALDLSIEPRWGAPEEDDAEKIAEILNREEMARVNRLQAKHGKEKISKLVAQAKQVLQLIRQNQNDIAKAIDSDPQLIKDFISTHNQRMDTVSIDGDSALTEYDVRGALRWARTTQPTLVDAQKVAEEFEDWQYIYANPEQTQLIETEDIGSAEEFIKYFDVDSIADLQNETSDLWADDEQELASQAFGNWMHTDAANPRGKIAYVNRQIQQLFDTFGWIVTADSTPGVDAEVITPVLKIAQGMSALDTMFSYIRDNTQISTNKNTGLHINIGTWNSAEINQVDWLKFLIIYYPNLALELFGREMNTYAPDKTSAIVKKLEQHNLDPFYSEIDKVNSIAIKISQKMSAVNLSKLPTRGHIEIRAPGNAGYENKSDQVKTQILRAIRALEIASNPNAYRKEYAKKLYQTLAKFGTKTSNASDIERFFAHTPKQASQDYPVRYNPANPLMAVIAKISSSRDELAFDDSLYTFSVHHQLIRDISASQRSPQHSLDYIKNAVDLLTPQMQNQVKNSKFFKLLVKSLINQSN